MLFAEMALVKSVKNCHVPENMCATPVEALESMFVPPNEVGKRATVLQVPVVKIGTPVVALVSKLVPPFDPGRSPGADHVPAFI